MFGDGDVFIAVWARTLLTMSVLWAGWLFHSGGRLGTTVRAAAVVLSLTLVNSPSVVGLIRSGASEYPTWIAFPLFFSMLFGPTRNAATGLFLLAASLITRTNQAPGLLWMLAIRGWTALRTHERRFIPGVVILAVVCLLPVSHNLYYGGRFVWLPTSATIPENLVLQPSTFWEAWHDETARKRVLDQLDYLLYGPVAHRDLRLTGAGLFPVFRGLQAVWVFALVLGLRRLWRSGERGDLIVLVTPAWFLATHLFYQLEVYYPRHIVIGHLAMAAVALYETARRDPGNRDSAVLVSPGAASDR